MMPTGKGKPEDDECSFNINFALLLYSQVINYCFKVIFPAIVCR